MESNVALIGFGEAAQAFAPALSRHCTLRAYDRKTDDPATAQAKHDDYRRIGVQGCANMALALSGAVATLSLVTAPEALLAARAAATLIEPDTFWFDMNSVAPGTKREAAAAIEAAGARYVDVAVMAPVHPAGHAVPLLVSGSDAEAGATLLRDLGFAEVRSVPGPVGLASSIKMIRSVMVKGIEALTAECVLAADAAGVLDEVLASLDASPPQAAWGPRADYNLDRMMVHGLRRAGEMEEVIRTLEALGTGSVMTRGTVERQRAIGMRGITDPPAGLDAKLAVLNPAKEAVAA